MTTVRSVPEIMTTRPPTTHISRVVTQPVAQPETTVTSVTTQSTDMVAQLQGQVNYWHQRFHDVETCFYQAKMQLSSVSEREQCLQAKIMQLETCHNHATDELCSLRLLIEEREVSLQDARKELALKQQELEAEKRFRQDELQRQSLRIEQRKATEAKLVETQRLLDGAWKDNKALQCQLQSMEHQLQMRGEEVNRLLVELTEERNLYHATVAENCVLQQKIKSLEEVVSEKESSLQFLEATCKQLSSELSDERKSHHAAVAETCELRQKVKALQEESAEHQRLADFWKSERDMWFCRSNHLEELNGRLHAGLHQIANDPQLIPMPPAHPPITPRPLICTRRSIEPVHVEHVHIEPVQPVQPVQLEIHTGHTGGYASS